MRDWKLKLKAYPHFDAPISYKDAMALITNPKNVISHKYLPFLTYTVTEDRILRNRQTKKIEYKTKERPIKYCARKDAYIYAYYRKLLLEKYEILLKKEGLDDCVIAYRQIPYVVNGRISGKSNINFAKEAFQEITSRGNCVAVALDLSDFFECLEHDKIKEKWSRLLNTKGLSKDHFRVFDHITNYEMVQQDACYIRLGLLAIDPVYKKRLYTFTKKKQLKQLCSMKDFREKIVGVGGKYESLIEKNPYIVEKGEFRGIPQGTPISDIIANMYMLDIDKLIKQIIDETGSYYRRYSDDMMLICPDMETAKTIISKVKEILQANEKYLQIKDSKTIITQFTSDKEPAFQSWKGNGEPIGNAFEYLGFSFDGKKTRLKSQAISRYHKKVRKGIRVVVRLAAARAKATNSSLGACLNISDLFHGYSNPNRNITRSNGKKPQSFTTYMKRSASLIGDQSISYQMRNRKKNIYKIIEQEIKKLEVNHK